MLKKFPKYFVMLVAGVLAVGTVALRAQSKGEVSDMQSQKKQADREIAQLKSELGKNQKAVTENLASLKKIDVQIDGAQKEIDMAKAHIETLKTKIEALEKDIDKGEGELKLLRDEYLKAVKKMRVARKKSSDLAFIFSSGSFSQAERRMRYMKEFSKWKTRQQEAISEQMAKLKRQHEELSTAKQDMDVAYRRELAAQNELKKQKEIQNNLVAELRANGDQLKEHLARKQSESRKLAGQISALIAQEQAKEAERKRIAAEKKAAEEKRLAEQKAAEEKRLAEQKAAQEKAAAAKQSKEMASAKEETPKETKPAKETKTSKPQQTSQPKETASAETRRRKRTDAPNAQTKTPAPAKTQPSANEPAQKSAPVKDTGFESMKGHLPRPVGGNFRIVSAFGVHPVSPDLPDIMDENLGIDAHVSAGASATAVYPGEVIKIYDRSNTPGFRNIVVVKHGDYITVYANLESLAVHAGQSVKQGQSLGTVGTDFDDPSQGLIHFEVWKGQTRQDPAAWIR